MSTPYPHIILFDGVCNLCSASVQFVIKRDAKAIFQYCSLQSRTGKRLLDQPYLQKNNNELQAIDWQSNGLSSVILLERRKVFTKSSAALTIARHLDWPWPLLYGFIVLPKFLRDAVYDFIGKHRYQWFGKRDSCWIPPDTHKHRFLDYNDIEVNNE